MKIREQYKDISGAPINEGDFLIMVNPTREERHKFYVEEVKEENDTVRIIRARVVESTDLTLKPGKDVLPLRIDASVPALGVVIPKDVFTKGLTDKQVDDVIAIELRKWLDNKPPHYKAKFAACVKFLQNTGFLETDADYRKVLRPRLARILKKNSDLFLSNGGIVYSTGKPIGGDTTTGYTNNPMSNVRVVDMTKLTMALRLILESGILGDVRFSNLE